MLKTEEVIVVDDTVCDALTMYVPTPPEAPAPSAVMMVPAVTPVPESATPTVSKPEVMPVTVSVPPPLIGVLPTFCGAPLTVYVPTPPAPVPSAMILVPAARDPPEMIMPTERAPEATDVTVSVAPATEPVTEAAAAAMEPVTTAVGASAGGVAAARSVPGAKVAPPGALPAAMTSALPLPVVTTDVAVIAVLPRVCDMLTK